MNKEAAAMLENLFKRDRPSLQMEGNQEARRQSVDLGQLCLSFAKQ